jgi:hypothetical protein
MNQQGSLVTKNSDVHFKKSISSLRAKSSPYIALVDGSGLIPLTATETSREVRRKENMPWPMRPMVLPA